MLRGISFPSSSHPARLNSHRKLVLLCWLVAVLIVVLMYDLHNTGWDAKIYWTAVQVTHHGADPYAVGIAVQHAYHNLPAGRNGPHPFSYVYPPMTLPLLHLAGMFPVWLAGTLFVIAIAAGVLLQAWAGYQLASASERRWLALLLPFTLFFPGLIHNVTILCGNIVCVLYGLVLAAGVRGWRYGKWFWYYAAVLLISIFKLPLLTLLFLPLLVGRRQWLSACMTGAAGVALFAIQPWLWPKLFREYLLAVRLQFDYNHDFGASPVGMFGTVLDGMGKPYSPAVTIFYLVFAVLVGVLLLHLAHRWRQGRISLERWLPVALVGTLLMNPRIMEYDAFAFTVPMLLLAWRAFRAVLDKAASLAGDGALLLMRGQESNNRPDLALLLAASGWFTAINLIRLGAEWKPTDAGVMLGVFCVGVGMLYWRAEGKGDVAEAASAAAAGTGEAGTRVSAGPPHAVIG